MRKRGNKHQFAINIDKVKIKVKMSGFTNEEYTDMVLLYGYCDGNAAAARAEYERRFPGRNCPNSRTITNSVRRLRETGSFTRPRRIERTTGTRSGDLRQRIVAIAANDPSISVRAIALRLHTSPNLVWRTLRSERLHPYHFRPVQELLVIDSQRRLQFCNWILQHHREDENFINNILWTDESQFSRSGATNFHNLHHWSQTNPHLAREMSHQRRFSVSLWIGVIGNELVGPFRLPSPLNSRGYLEFLRNEIEEYFDNLSLERRRSLIYQHDGAPAHSAQIVKNWFDDNFPSRWIGRNGPIQWPPRSPDLTILDFFVWGTMKEMVYSVPIRNLAELNSRIDSAADKIREQLRRMNVPQVISKRARLCIRYNGGHFENEL